MLAFRTDDNSSFPVSFLKANSTLNVELDALNQEKTILGVFLEKNNEIKTLLVNREIVVDGGQQMLENLRHNQDKEILKENLSMSENQVQSFRESVEQIQREEHERQQVITIV